MISKHFYPYYLLFLHKKHFSAIHEFVTIVRPVIIGPVIATVRNCTFFTQALSLTQGVVRKSRISILGNAVLTRTKKGLIFGVKQISPKITHVFEHAFESVKYFKKLNGPF